MMEIYKTYNKVKDLFVKPKLKFGISRWWNIPILEYSVDRFKPWYLRFGYCSYDVIWKDKYNSPRFEYSPAIILTLFGISFYLYLSYKHIDLYEDDIWECILAKIYYSKQSQLIELIENCGYYRPDNNLIFRKEFLKPEYHKLYDENKAKILNKLIKNNENKI